MVSSKTPGAPGLGSLIWSVGATALLASAFWLPSAQGQAVIVPPQITDAFSIQVGITEEYDDNLFRLPDGAPPTAVPGETARSDLLSTQTVGFKFNKTYSLQNIDISLNLVNYDYRTYSYLNFLGTNGSATWHWAVTPELTGDIGINRTQSINSFSDVEGSSARNVNTTDNERVDIDYRVAGEWHAMAAVYNLNQSNNVPVFELENVRITSFEPSLRYQAPSGNSIALYFRTADGSYLNQPLDPALQVDNGFTEHEEGIRVVYQTGGKSSLYAQVGELTRSNEHFSSRNFDGPVATLAYSLELTGQVTAFFNASRALVSYQTDTSSYLVDTVYSIGPTWAITDKTSIGARFQQVQYKFQNALPGVPGPLRDDISDRVNLNASWNAFRNFTLTGSLIHQTRRSNLPGLQYIDNVSSIQASYAF